MHCRRPASPPTHAVRAAIAAAFAAVAGTASAEPYAVTPIAPHDSSRWIQVEGVALNQVGGVAGNDVTEGRPFRWSAAAGLEWLDNLPDAGAHTAQAWDINDAGVVVGIGRARTTHRVRVNRPVAWMPGSAVPRDLGAGLNPKAHEPWEGYAYSINASGVVSGISGPILGDYAFTFDLATGTPAFLGPVLYPYMINDAGATAGAGPYDPVSGTSIYQLREPDGRRVDLPRWAFAASLNNVGQLAGTYGIGQAFVWSEAAGLTILPPLPDLPNCVANGLNDQGVVIGTCHYDERQAHAVLWTPDAAGGYVAQDVLELIAPAQRPPVRCAVKPDGAHRCLGLDGIAINNAGQLLVNQRKTGKLSYVDSQPVLLTPPAAR